MRPILETIKSDKVIDENFESVKNVLCGNVSLDNMNVRILEGITQDADIQNLVIHSGNTRPVLCLPLIGDVYFQEISDKYVDIRSTKPQVAYKVLVMFGPAITDATLKEVGGPNYKDTNTVTEETVTEEISYIEQQEIKYKPLAIQSYTLPNPCASGGPPTSQYIKAIAGSENIYVLAASQKVLWRINKTTGTVTSLDFSAAIGAGAVTAMRAYGSHIYVAATSSVSAKHEVYQVDPSTFTVSTTFTGDSNANRHGWVDLYIDDNYIFGDFNSVNNRVAYLTRITRSGGAVSTITLRTSIGAGYYSYPGAIAYVPTGVITDASLWIPIETNDTASAIVCRVEVEDVITGAPLFTLTDSLTSTYAFAIRNIVNSGNTLYAPAIYTAAHDTQGGTVAYISGIVKISPTAPYPITFVPIDIPYYSMHFLNTFIDGDDGYLYSVFPFLDFPNGGGTVIIRLATGTDEIAVFFIPLCITGYSDVNAIDNWAFKDSDGTLLFLKNPTATDYSNFTYATVDFTDYDV